MTQWSDEWTDLDDRAVATARALAADAVQKVGNGHPGTAMALAPAAYLLFQRFLRHDPAHPEWLGRDRFILSCGHSSLTLYIQLYLSGYEISLDDLKSFRTMGAVTAGHPEHMTRRGIEMTTGPLGQGIASAVGIAMAQRYTRGLLDPEAPTGESPFDSTVWVLASDGDLEEGISAEASSLAGLQELGNLIVIWDDNHISIEGDTEVAFTEDLPARYRSYGWETITVPLGSDGSVDLPRLAAALEAARANTAQPTLIALRTIIGWPAPNLQNTGQSHGAALGAEEVAMVKEALGMDPQVHFYIDDKVLDRAREVGERGAAVHAEWDERFQAWRTSQPERAALLDRLVSRELPEGWADVLPTFEAGTKIATRKASSKTINALAGVLPELWGGSADLGESNGTNIEGGGDFLPASSPQAGADPYGRIVHFGVREHAMGAVLNGIGLHGLTRSFGGTFLVFSDYMRPSVRLASLMTVPSIFVWTHDSVGVGEDGPTHQPVEHLWSLRAIPEFTVVRPADASEVVEAWAATLGNPGPTGLILTRQDVPVLDRSEALARAEQSGMGTGPGGLTALGGYVLVDASNGAPELLLLATGSEVAVAVAARELLEADGVPTRVVSLPSLEWFEAQPQEYRDSVLPPSVRARVSVEAGSAIGWWKYVGDAGDTVSMDYFGASAAAAELFEQIGFTAENVASVARGVLRRLG